MPQREERLYTLIAKVDPTTGQPLLGDATVLTGYGSVKFTAGRTDNSVPETVAKALLASRPDELDAIPSDSFGIAPDPMEMPEDTAAAIEAKHTAAAAAVQRAVDSDEMIEVEMGGQKVLVPASVIKQAAGSALTPVVEKTVKPVSAPQAAKVNLEGNEAALAAAREHLEGEGAEVPASAPAAAAPTPEPETAPEDKTPATPARAVPPGFDEKTGEDELRCLAVTASGSQCKNAAVDGGPACRMEAHVKQFTGGE